MLARCLSVLSITALAVLLSAAHASAQVAKVEKPQPTYMVVEVGEDSFQIIQSDDFEKAQKEIDETYRESLEAWKTAKKKNPKLEQKQPVKSKLTIVARNLADMEAAREALQKAMDKKVVAKQPKQPKQPKKGKDR